MLTKTIRIACLVVCVVGSAGCHKPTPEMVEVQKMRPQMHYTSVTERDAVETSSARLIQRMHELNRRGVHGQAFQDAMAAARKKEFDEMEYKTRGNHR